MKKRFLFLIAVIFIAAGCATVQSIVKSTFPYTADLILPVSSQTGTEFSVISKATSFDQVFDKNGNTGDKVSQVHMVSAKLQSVDPSMFNIGDISSVKVYVSNSTGGNEVLVASRSDIGASVGNNLVLDIDNTHFLDEYVRKASIRVRMRYVLRNKLTSDVSLKLSLGLSASPSY